MPAYQILTIDGGGIRGLITAILLERLETAHPGFLSRFDLLAGTSTGGLLALGLAAGLSPSDARRLYEELGPRVFVDSPFDDLVDLGKLTGAEYRLEPLRDALQDRFGDLRLGDLPKKVLISTFQLDNHAAAPAQRSWKAKFFHNYPGPGSDALMRVVEVGLYTALAPSYFPICDGYIDGGVVANNPSMCALAQALHPETGGRKLEDLALLSFGTGHNPRFLEVDHADWGLVSWAPHLVNLMLEGSAGLADYQCRQLLGSRYLRVNPPLPRPVGVDRIDQIPLLQAVAAGCDLDDAVEWVGRELVCR